LNLCQIEPDALAALRAHI